MSKHSTPIEISKTNVIAPTTMGCCLSSSDSNLDHSPLIESGSLSNVAQAPPTPAEVPSARPTAKSAEDPQPPAPQFVSAEPEATVSESTTAARRASLALAGGDWSEVGKTDNQHGISRERKQSLDEWQAKQDAKKRSNKAKRRASGISEKNNFGTVLDGASSEKAVEKAVGNEPTDENIDATDVMQPTDVAAEVLQIKTIQQQIAAIQAQLQTGDFSRCKDLKKLQEQQQAQDEMPTVAVDRRSRGQSMENEGEITGEDSVVATEGKRKKKRFSLTGKIRRKSKDGGEQETATTKKKRWSRGRKSRKSKKEIEQAL